LIARRYSAGLFAKLGKRKIVALAVRSTALAQDCNRIEHDRGEDVSTFRAGGFCLSLRAIRARGI
jgi:hypothetical protein